VKAQAVVYRAGGGRIGYPFGNDAAVPLLTTTGRRSGRERTTPAKTRREITVVVLVSSMGRDAA
jgi:F420H(2)-dependent quinone reductase